MAIYEHGARVGAISRATESEVYMFGYGIYLGRITPPPWDLVQFFGMPMDRPNPCILLDCGKRVYGCECWWGAEDRVREMVGGRRVVFVDIESLRRRLWNDIASTPSSPSG